MKTFRTLAIAIIAVLVISAFAPSYAYAMPGSADVTAKSQFAQLIVNNRTGGTLYVKLSSPAANYWFSAPNQGKTTFSNIKPGKYTAVLSTSACQGSLKYKMNMKAGGKSAMKPVVCRK